MKYKQTRLISQDQLRLTTMAGLMFYYFSNQF